MQNGADARRATVARWLLVPLVVLVLIGTAVAPFISVWGLDNRTSMEMVDGVKRHGLPYTTNGDLDFDKYAEARVPFNLAVGGKLWGQYGPLYPYVAAPAAMIDGVRGLYRFNVLLVGIGSLCVFFLGRRLSNDPYVGVGAAYVFACSSPALMYSFETLAGPLLLVMITLATYFGVRAVETASRPTFFFAALAGFFAAASTATHMVAAPMSALLIYGIGVARVDATPANAGFLGRLAAFVPKGVGARRFGIALVVFATALVPVALLNHIRFSTYNPISYGPCPWLHCNLAVKDSLNTATLIKFAAPAIPWSVGVVLGVVFAWGSAKRLAIVFALAGAALIPPTSMRETVVTLLVTVYGYAADVSNMAFADFLRPADGLGNLNTNRCVKSLLQCTPILAAAALVPFRTSGAAARNLVVLMPVIGLFMGLSLLGRFAGASAFGWPYLFLRYTLPAVPLLAVLAIHGVRDLPWRRWTIAVVVVGGLAGAALLAQRLDDLPYPRRFVELRITLFAGVALVALVLASRRSTKAWLRQAALVPASVALALGVAVCIGVDGRLATQQTADIDKRVSRFAALTPARLALVGSALDTDQLLSLKMERDIVYIDFTEAKGWRNFRELIDRWSDEGRPIFGAFPRDGSFRWPYADWDVPAERIDAAQEFWRIGPPRARAPERRPDTPD